MIRAVTVFSLRYLRRGLVDGAVAMGAGASINPALPDDLDRAAVHALAGDGRYDDRLFTAFRDPLTDRVPKRIVESYATLTDVYVSFAWGRDRERRRTKGGGGGGGPGAVIERRG